jgi:hypothetical protein
MPTARSASVLERDLTVGGIALRGRINKQLYLIRPDT